MSDPDSEASIDSDDFELDINVLDVIHADSDVSDVVERNGERPNYIDYAVVPLRRIRILSRAAPNHDDDAMDSPIAYERNEFTPPLSVNDSMSTDDGEIEEFNRDLPAQHSYLGDNMEIVPGRTILDEYSVYNLPLLAHHSIIFPGQTLPMMPHISLAEKLFPISEGGRIFGLVCPDETGSKIFRYGVTCEIYEKETQNSGTIKIKAKGRQRFKILGAVRDLRDYVSILNQHVLILPEVSIGDPLTPAKLLSLNKYRHTKDNGKLNRTIRRSDAIQTRWPSFVYNLYDERIIIDKIRTHMRQYDIEHMPIEPVALSFWVAYNLQFDAPKRLKLFKINSALHRLKLELEYMEKLNLLKCKNCHRLIANATDLFAMSNDGIQSHYCNPDGWIHETFTVLKAEGATLHGRSSNQATWFPGYAWTIALCYGCRSHVGWLFTANKRSLRPQQFWGLCRASIISVLPVEDQNNQVVARWGPVEA